MDEAILNMVDAAWGASTRDDDGLSARPKWGVISAQRS